MATDRKPLAARLQRKAPKAQCRLRVEPLESRAMLSHVVWIGLMSRPPHGGVADFAREMPGLEMQSLAEGGPAGRANARPEHDQPPATRSLATSEAPATATFSAEATQPHWPSDMLNRPSDPSSSGDAHSDAPHSSSPENPVTESTSETPLTSPETVSPVEDGSDCLTDTAPEQQARVVGPYWAAIQAPVIKIAAAWPEAWFAPAGTVPVGASEGGRDCDAGNIEVVLTKQAVMAVSSSAPGGTSAMHHLASLSNGQTNPTPDSTDGASSVGTPLTAHALPHTTLPDQGGLFQDGNLPSAAPSDQFGPVRQPALSASTPVGSVLPSRDPSAPASSPSVPAVSRQQDTRQAPMITSLPATSPDAKSSGTSDWEASPVLERGRLTESRGTAWPSFNLATSEGGFIEDVTLEGSRASARTPSSRISPPSLSIADRELSRPNLDVPGGEEGAADESGLARQGDPPAEPSNDGGRLQDPASEPAWAMTSGEGGMIELAAAGVSPTGASLRAADRPGGTGGTVMEDGVASFHAFELASLPAGRLEAEAAVEVSPDDSLPPDAVGVPSDSDAPMAQDTAWLLPRWGGQTAQHAALPALGIAALLAAVDAVHLEGGASQRERRDWKGLRPLGRRE
jgi:hypothetical protein